MSTDPDMRLTYQYWLFIIIRDQPNSRFHGRDIFREIGLLLWKTPISVFPWNSVKSVIFSWILWRFSEFYQQLTAFVQILLFATCHTSALS